MIIQIEDSYKNWYLREINSFSHVWKLVISKPGAKWWKVYKASDHRAQPDYSYVKEVKGKYTKVYFKGGEGA